MSSDPDLLLYESILLLALHDEKGTTQEPMFHYAVAGGIMAELLLRGRLRTEVRRKKPMLAVVDPTPTGIPLLDEALSRIHAAKRAASMQTWIGRIAQTRDLRHRVAERLYVMGILRKHEDRILWVFPRVRYPTSNPDPEQKLMAALERAITEDGEVEANVAIIAALAHGSGILPQVLDKKLLKARKDRITVLTNMNAVGGATKAAIEAARAAVAAATSAALVTTTVSS